MHADYVCKLWLDYRRKAIDETIHPNDHMFNTAANGMKDYLGVGVSAAQMIYSVLNFTPTNTIRQILDFGCGHGRVARHLRAMFPEAALFFTDIDETGVAFCAQRFNGEGIVSTTKLPELELPTGMDLVWVGSVFTHLDFERSIILFDKLVGALGPRGVLIATFRGENMYRIMKKEQAPSYREKWKAALEGYETGGIGYGPYDAADPDWGASLTSIARVASLGQRHRDLRLIAYAEADWAAAHDVAAWTRHVHN